MPKIRIRLMEEKDLETVAELAMLANPFAEKDSYKKHIIEELKENPKLSLVAVNEKDEVLGHAQADIRRGGVAVLEDIAVSQNWQGRGIGKQLLERELKELEKKGAKIVMAEVHYKCAKAIPFYYKFGFRIVGFVQDYFGKGHDTIILKLEL